MKTEKQQAQAAGEFARRWKGRGYEKGESQVFWTELVTEVFGVENRIYLRLQNSKFAEI